MSHSGGTAKGRGPRAQGRVEGTLWGRGDGDGAQGVRVARLHRCSCRGPAKAGNSVIGQAFLERVLWQWSEAKLRVAHLGRQRGHLETEPPGICCEKVEEELKKERGGCDPKQRQQGGGGAASGETQRRWIYWLVVLVAAEGGEDAN